jgi:hypothetical protein
MTLMPVPFAILIDFDTRPFGEDSSGQALVDLVWADGPRIVEVEPMSRLTE